MTYNYLNSRPFSITPKMTSDEGFMQMQKNNADQAGIVVRIDSELGGFTSEEDDDEVNHKIDPKHNNTREASDSDNDSHSQPSNDNMEDFMLKELQSVIIEEKSKQEKLQ